MKNKAMTRCVITIDRTEIVLAETPSNEILAKLFEVFRAARVVDRKYKYDPREGKFESIEGLVYSDDAQLAVSFKPGPFLEQDEWERQEAEFLAKIKSDTVTEAPHA